ncbi:unnamed protein product, partial [Vitis vinifera]
MSDSFFLNTHKNLAFGQPLHPCGLFMGLEFDPGWLNQAQWSNAPAFWIFELPIPVIQEYRINLTEAVDDQTTAFRC